LVEEYVARNIWGRRIAEEETLAVSIGVLKEKRGEEEDMSSPQTSIRHPARGKKCIVDRK
jgi:hypothetical protein